MSLRYKNLSRDKFVTSITISNVLEDVMSRVRDIQDFIRVVVSSDTKATIQSIESQMLGEDVSYIPIIQAKRNNRGFIV